MAVAIVLRDKSMRCSLHIQVVRRLKPYELTPCAGGFERIESSASVSAKEQHPETEY